MLTNSIRGARISAAALLLAAPAAAQFPGDFFFTDPSPAVAEGEAVLLEVQVFTGTAAFGAAAFDVVFDPLLLAVDEVNVSPASPLPATAYDVALPAGRGVAAFNDGSLAAPFGSVALVEIAATPLVPAGESVQVTLVPRELLAPNGTPFPTIGGFSAVVTVLPAAPQLAAAPPAEEQHQAGPVAPWLDPLFGNVPLRPAGHAVEVWQRVLTPLGPVTWRRVRVVTRDPGAASD